MICFVRAVGASATRNTTSAELLRFRVDGIKLRLGMANPFLNNSHSTHHDLFAVVLPSV